MLPDSDAEMNPPTRNNKKRPRDSSIGAESPKIRRPLCATNAMLRPNEASLDDLIGPLMDKVQQGFKEILDELRKSQSTLSPDARRLAMDELNKDKYMGILSDSNARESICESFRDHNLAKDFVLYPDSFKINFLQDIVAKRRVQTSNS